MFFYDFLQVVLHILKHYVVNCPLVLGFAEVVVLNSSQRYLDPDDVLATLQDLENFVLAAQLISDSLHALDGISFFGLPVLDQEHRAYASDRSTENPRTQVAQGLVVGRFHICRRDDAI